VKLETDPTITFVIMSYLRSWRTGEGIVYDAPIYFQQLLHDQQLVGWGRFSKDGSLKTGVYYNKGTIALLVPGEQVADGR